MVEFNVLDRQYQRYAAEYQAAALRVLGSGWYILGREVEAFEAQFAAFCETSYCVGLNSGLDALILAFRALGIGAGDEVIVPANTYIASVIGVTEAGATPVFVEPDAYHNLDAGRIEAAITSRTKAILPVHLYGQACNMRKILEIAKKHQLFLVEDSAQSHGARFEGQVTGTFGDIGCFSFYPTKNLGAFGDGGAIITADSRIAERVKMLRNYGSRVKYHHEIEGVNSRLDEMQAALLSVKLGHLLELNAERIGIAERYLDGICNPKVVLPKRLDRADHVYHLFVVMCAQRDLLQEHLLDHGIKTQVHYPYPPHLSECYHHRGYHQTSYPETERYAKEVLSLPLYNGMTNEEIDYVVRAVNEF